MLDLPVRQSMLCIIYIAIICNFVPDVPMVRHTTNFPRQNESTRFQCNSHVFLDFYMEEDVGRCIIAQLQCGCTTSSLHMLIQASEPRPFIICQSGYLSSLDPRPSFRFYNG